MRTRLNNTAAILVLVLGSDLLEELNVVIAVEPRHVLLGGRVGPIDIHLPALAKGRCFQRAEDRSILGPDKNSPPVQSVVEQQRMGHADPMRLHRMALSIIVIADLGLVKVGDLLHRAGRGGRDGKPPQKGKHTMYMQVSWPDGPWSGAEDLDGTRRARWDRSPCGAKGLLAQRAKAKSVPARTFAHQTFISTPKSGAGAADASTGTRSMSPPVFRSLRVSRARDRFPVPAATYLFSGSHFDQRVSLDS